MMESLMRLVRRARLLLRAREVEASMDEEMRLHIELEAEELMRTRGLGHAEALRRARIAFGGEDRFRELGRDARGVRSVQDGARAVAHAVRTLRRSAGFTTVSVLMIGLGLGAVATIFALVRAILLEPLPYDDADRLVAIRHAAPGIDLEDAGLSSGTYFHYRDRASSLEAIAVYTEAVVNLSGDDVVAERVELAMSGPALFEVLRARPVLGRVFSAADAQRDMMDYTGVFPVLLSEELWRRRYDADPDIVGRMIYINARAREVVGVLPAHFDFPSPRTQIWLLSVPPEQTADFARSFDYDGVARLRDGISRQQAQQDLAAVVAGMEGAYADATAERMAEVQLRPVVVPLKDTIVGDTGTALWILLGGMTLLLVVVCSNVANLFVVRAEHRVQEIALRRALGAGRRDLVRLFALESGVIAAAGTLAGVLLAAWALRALALSSAVDLPRLHEVDLDGIVLAGTAVLGVVVAALLATLAMLHSTRATVGQAVLRSAQHGVTAGRGSRRLRSALLAAQVALALTLLIGSALLVQSFRQLARVETGFAADGVLTVDMGLPFSRAARHKQIYDELLERVRALPGVVDAAAATDLPLTERVWTASLAYPFHIAEPVTAAHTGQPIALKFFMPGYFEVMRIPVLEGRSISPTAPPETERPVLVSAGLARRLFPGMSAVGRRIRRLERSGEEIWMRAPDGTRVQQPDYVIAGVVGDVRQESLRSAPTETVYVPVLEPRVDPQFVPTEMSLVIRAGVPPMMLAPAVREIIRDVDPVLGVAQVRPLSGIVAAATARERFLAQLLVIAATASLFLGAVGIYGVLAYIVRQRTREIGIRIALGARARGVAASVMRESLGVVMLGIAAGLVVALPATRLLRSILFGVSPGDPAIIAAMTLLLLTVALGATLLPARRAVRIDPMTAMRAE